MRVTNQMMTNNMLSHINQNKLNMSTLENQYSTGKKILKPSDDPIIAVRALKLRSNLSELSQYVSRNIPDAQSWMEVTESSLDNVNSIITQMNKYCVQGSSDTLTAKDRTNIIENLIQLKDQIYQEGNAQYAGRYVFTGFKTDTPLIYTSQKTYQPEAVKLKVEAGNVTEDTTKNTYTMSLDAGISGIKKVTIGTTDVTEFTQMTKAEFDKITPEADKAYYLVDTNQVVLGGNYSDAATDGVAIEAERYQGYNITEKLDGKNINLVSSVVIPTDEKKSPYTVQVSRLQLSYDKLNTQTVKNADGTETTSALKSLTYKVGDTESTLAVTKTMSSTDVGAYEIGENDVVVLADTGEVLFGTSIAKKLQDASEISVNYDKNTFADGELKPEHFFDCTYYGAEGKNVHYEKKDQDITYEVNFGQTLKVNTEAKDAITHEYDRLVDDLTIAVNNVTAIEKNISTLECDLKNVNLSDEERAKKEDQLEQQKTALTLSKSILQTSFSQAITTTQKYEDKVNVAVADLGSRAKRLELTKERLEDQQVELEDLKSSNEDVDLVEAVIRYKSAEAIYTSSLTAASSVIKTNLLNFL